MFHNNRCDKSLMIINNKMMSMEIHTRINKNLSIVMKYVVTIIALLFQ